MSLIYCRLRSEYNVGKKRSELIRDKINRIEKNCYKQQLAVE